MNELAKKIKNDESPYTIVLHWHLGHVAPTTDDEFIPTGRYMLLHFSAKVHTQETACSEQDSEYPVGWRNCPVYGDETVEGDAGRRGGKCAQ